jgi:hypothetical protein
MRLKDEVNRIRKELDEQLKHREILEDEVNNLNQQLLRMNYEEEVISVLRS